MNSAITQRCTEILDEFKQCINKNQLESILQNNTESIAELVEARTNGDINEEDFSIELLREKRVLKAEMIGLEITSKACIEKKMNSLLEVLSCQVRQ